VELLFKNQIGYEEVGKEEEGVYCQCCGGERGCLSLFVLCRFFLSQIISDSGVRNLLNEGGVDDMVQRIEKIVGLKK